MIDLAAADEISDDARARSNLARLAAAQALTGANSAVIFATGSIVGAALAPDMSLATVPLSMYVLGLAAGTLPTGAISRAYGRRIAFMIGTGCGVLTGLLGSFAILRGSFALFCCATFLGGLYGAVSQSYRFAAADCASAAFRPKAVSWVMAGGIFAGVLGPQLVQWTMDIWAPSLFAFSFVVQAAVALVAMLILYGVDAPKPAASDVHGGRPLFTIVRKPRFIAAAICGIVAYPMMNLVMTSAPLAMKMCGLTLSDSNVGIQWHIVAMYGPSFFTGSLIARFGAKGGRNGIVTGGDRRDGWSFRHHGASFLGHAVCSRRSLESRLRRRLRSGFGNPSAAGAQQGSGIQRFPGVRNDGDRFILVRAIACELRLVGGESGGVSAGAVWSGGTGVHVVRKKANEIAAAVGISGSEHLKSLAALRETVERSPCRPVNA